MLLGATAAMLIWSACDKHRAGELPEVQKEHHDDIVKPGAEAHPAAASPHGSVSPTPAEFFPSASPH